MSPPVWATFSVRDHLRRGAFLRDVLLFDRLVVPAPITDAERDRWRSPVAGDLETTWDPGRLDRLFAILGTDEQPSDRGAQVVRRIEWSPERWESLLSQLELAGMVTGDAYYNTAQAMILGRNQLEVPGIVDVVSAYASRASWSREAQLVAAPEQGDAGGDPGGQPGGILARDAIVQLARPLILPPDDLTEEDQLRAAVELSLRPDYRAMRTAYFDWFRDLIEPLRSGDLPWTEVVVDRASMREAAEQLRRLRAEEERIIREHDGRRRWTRAEWGVMALTAGITGAGPLAESQPLLAGGLTIAGGLATFAGFALGKKAPAEQPRALGGASMFTALETSLGWAPPA